jgi:hypothetical protein
VDHDGFVHDRFVHEKDADATRSDNPDAMSCHGALCPVRAAAAMPTLPKLGPVAPAEKSLKIEGTARPAGGRNRRVEALFRRKTV